MRDQGGGLLFSPPIERKKVSVKLSGREEGNELPRRRPGFGGESNYGNGGAKIMGSVLQAGRLKGGSSMPSNGNGARSYNEEVHMERLSPVAKAPEEGLLPQWGRGKRSRCSRPEASNKHAPSPPPAQESSAPPPNKKHLSNGISSSKLRSQGSSKAPSSKFSAPERPLSRNGLINKPVNGSAQTSGFDSTRPVLDAKERASSLQKRCADYGSGRQQQRSEGSDLATTNNGLGNCVENVTVMYHTTNGTGVMCEGNGLDCNKPKAEWPRISISLSRKEKEEDFFLFKGSKLPQRPKKRLKVVEKALLFCTPGNWLSDISRGRYDVREKKSTKKKPRGLKAMDSAESDSE
ncbi:hypothetical protein GOP47_0003633 [Adiantum capillus-veneris]|uniref:Uncharacterized protein n=1 Tax=Adiantum capillus-veneris TaxID=13818 RepID=A0A9D4V6N5_ADICA|nr:hypothetical protein GOP47_0003633 [Adiantum capillus-veneris]